MAQLRNIVGTTSSARKVQTLYVDTLHPLHILPQAQSVEEESCIIKCLHHTICFKLIHLALNESWHEPLLDTAESSNAVYRSILAY